MNSRQPPAAAMPAAPDHQLAEHGYTLRALANVLHEIAAVDWVCADGRAHGILGQIAQSRTPVEVDAHMDRLLVRIGELIAERTGDNSELYRLTALTGPRARPRLFSHAHQAVGSNAHGTSARPRAFMKL